MRKSALIFVFGAGLLAGAVAGHAQEKIEVLTLRYHSAQEILPLIEPLVGKDGAVTGMQNRLIIRTDAAHLAQIKKVLASVDTQPKRLQITVRQHTTREALSRDADIYGSLGGHSTRLRVPRQSEGSANIEALGARGRVGANITSTRDIESSADSQTLQVLEGNAAFIRVGQSVPYTAQSIYRDGRRTTVVQDTQFQDATSGFYVLPRLAGETVTLEIRPQHNTVDGQGRLNIQEASTTISARLGEWIELGGVGQRSHSSGNGAVYSTRDISEDNRSIFVRVDSLP